MAEKSLALTEQVVSLTSPKGLLDFANTLKQFIVEQKLYVVISSKKYVEVQGWQFAGASMGIMPVVTKCEPVATANDKEVKYRAEVELRRVGLTDVDGKPVIEVVGYGVAFCSNQEPKKKSFEDYAVASMAQTRATGKAYRNAFGWLMKVAGYEATPAEEMDGANGKAAVGGLTDEVKEKIAKAKSAQEISDILGALPAEDKKAATELIAERLKAIKKPAKKNDDIDQTQPEDYMSNEEQTARDLMDDDIGDK